LTVKFNNRNLQQWCSACTTVEGIFFWDYSIKTRRHTWYVCSFH